MNSFQYRDSQLFAEDVSLSQIAQQYGTPCYVYSRAALEHNFLAYRNAMGEQSHLICYAVKANSNLAVLNILARLGAGFDIVSGGELQRVMAAGGDPSRVIFSGVGKTAEEMRMALEAGIHCFNVESEAELERLNSVAIETGHSAPVSLRVNPDVDAGTHPYISTGLKDNKFGVEISYAPHIYRKARSLPGISIKGVDCHIGSQLTSVEPFVDALQRVLLLVDELAADGITLNHLDLGGGLGVRYHDENPPSEDDYVGTLLGHIADRDITLILEPGRSICADAGLLLTRVEYLKHSDHKHFAVVDAAMNDMLRPALYQAWMDIIPVVPNLDAQQLGYDVVGPICESSDFLGKDRQLALSQGDLLAQTMAGAYGFGMSSNYNSRNRAAEVMVDGAQSYLVRARENFQQQITGEQILPEQST